jgi:hypothetical protein
MFSRGSERMCIGWRRVIVTLVVRITATFRINLIL